MGGTASIGDSRERLAEVGVGGIVVRRRRSLSRASVGERCFLVTGAPSSAMETCVAEKVIGRAATLAMKDVRMGSTMGTSGRVSFKSSMEDFLLGNEGREGK
jgi:hypothetical protein